MRTSFRIHPVIVPGESKELRFVNTGITGMFTFLRMENFFCVFEDAEGNVFRVLYADIRWARG